MITEQLDFTGRVAIVTGGATGIGYATALQLAGPCVLEAWKVATLDPDAIGCAIPLRRTGTTVACPRCGSPQTQRVSQFGSTACKAHYRCLACLEPFDYFKPH